MNKLKGMKFYIGNDPELSKKVQDILFNMGYKWAGSNRHHEFSDSCWLYTRESGHITHNYHKCDDNGDEREIINIDWMRSTRATVKVGDKTYWEDELAGALASINPVEG